MWAPSFSIFFHFHAVFGKNLDKQECIPVGCLSPAGVAVPGGGFSTRHPPGIRHPPEQTPPGTRHPSARTRQPPAADPPGSRHPLPGTRTPLLPESQTPVKILPCPNFVAGGNNRLSLLRVGDPCEKSRIRH